jgi:transcriptional regulator with XRE-family HTH domain
MNFAENLLRLRLKNGLKQQEVADGVGLSLRGYQNYERGLREPQISPLVALADFYGLTVDELIGHKPKR